MQNYDYSSPFRRPDEDRRMMDDDRRRTEMDARRPQDDRRQQDLFVQVNYCGSFRVFFLQQ